MATQNPNADVLLLVPDAGGFVTPDLAGNKNFRVEMGRDITVNNPKNSAPGFEFTLEMKQLSPGGFKAKFGSRFFVDSKAPPMLSRPAHSLDIYRGYDAGVDGYRRIGWLPGPGAAMAPATVPPVIIPPVIIPPVNGPRYPWAARLAPYVDGSIVPAGGITQAARDKHCTDQFNYWKTGNAPGLGGIYPAFQGDPNRVVSEGIGYAMILAALFAGYDPGAQKLFDAIYNVARTHPAYGIGEPDLMEWRLNRTYGNNGSDGWGYCAPDGDFDIAYGLLMADRQWGSAGAVDYKTRAVAVISALKRHVFRRGDFTSRSGGRDDLTRMSDYMTGHYKAFKKATGDVFWDACGDKAFSLLTRCQSVLSPVGLVPDFLIHMDTATPIADRDHIGDESPWSDCFFWNSCRMALRLGCDYLTTGDVRARASGSKLVDFFDKKHGGNPGLITNGYRMDGSEIYPGSGYHPDVFIATLAPAAMGEARLQTYLDAVWNESNMRRATGYYGTELQLMSMTVAAGNWWTP